MRARLAAAIVIMASASVAQTPPTYVQMPYLGVVDKTTGLLRSFDSGSQHVGIAPYFREWFYQFPFDASIGSSLKYWIDTSTGYGAAIEVQDAGHRSLGLLSGPLPPLTSGNYFVHVTASSPTLFHFGLFARPALEQYANDAGRTKDTALDLGTLTSGLGHANSFYTYYQRTAPSFTTSSAAGVLTPDFNNASPYPPSPDWYRFTLVQSASVTLSASGALPGPTYVLLAADGRSTIWVKGQTLPLQSGTYWLQVVDQVTQVAGGGAGGLVYFRNPHVEDFEHYQFLLSTSPNGSPGQGGAATVDLSATLVDVNTNTGIGGHSTSTMAGAPIAVTYRINNFGSPASGSGHVAFYVSKTPTLTPASIFLVYGSLFDAVPASGSIQGVSNVTLPSTLANGTYYIIVVANFDHVITESNYANNASNALQITVAGRP